MPFFRRLFLSLFLWSLLLAVYPAFVLEFFLCSVLCFFPSRRPCLASVVRYSFLPFCLSVFPAFLFPCFFLSFLVSLLASCYLSVFLSSFVSVFFLSFFRPSFLPSFLSFSPCWRLAFLLSSFVSVFFLSFFRPSFLSGFLSVLRPFFLSPLPGVWHSCFLPCFLCSFLSFRLPFLSFFLSSVFNLTPEKYTEKNTRKIDRKNTVPEPSGRSASLCSCTVCDSSSCLALQTGDLWINHL